jgi:hypothetical protein
MTAAPRHWRSTPESPKARQQAFELGWMIGLHPNVYS